MSFEPKNLPDQHKDKNQNNRKQDTQNTERKHSLDQVIAVKLREGIPAAIPERVEEVVAHVRAEAEDAGVPQELAGVLWRSLIGWSIDYEEGHIKCGKS